MTVASLALASCARERAPGPLDHGWAPAGACVFVGNRADRHYCATTGTQLLANPAVYDGHLVQVSGWVVSSPDGREAALFLTKDAYETTALQGSVNLEGAAVPRIAAMADRARSEFTPVQTRVQGRFRLHGLGADGSRPRRGFDAMFRFGAIEEVDEWP
jgi:hypothetical protein